MPVTVIIGGQFGSEGKGKVAHFLAEQMKASVAIRIGGANSGHTVISPSGQPLIFRHLPTACLLPWVTCVIGAGSYLDTDLLLEEIRITGLSPSRLVVDENAMVIRSEDRESERARGMRKSIGSTLSGTGAAVARRIWRGQDVELAKHNPHLRKFVRPSIDLIASALDRGERVIVEGTQGFGLSLLHSPHYPKVTSRDTTAAAFLSEAGLSPLHMDDVVLVIRAFPIRVPGDSGVLPNEIDWGTVTRESESKAPLVEYTSVTKQIRRVARFDPDIVKKAVLHNAPTQIVLNHLDYVDKNWTTNQEPPTKIMTFVENVEDSIGRRIDYLGSSPNLLCPRNNVIRRRRVA